MPFKSHKFHNRRFKAAIYPHRVQTDPKFTRKVTKLLHKKQRVHFFLKSSILFKSCGHVCHYKCLEQYKNSSERGKYLLEGEICCPVCKSPGNCYIPVVEQAEPVLQRNNEFKLEKILYLFSDTLLFEKIKNSATINKTCSLEKIYRLVLDNFVSKLMHFQIKNYEFFAKANFKLKRETNRKNEINEKFEIGKILINSLSYLIKYSEVIGVHCFLKNFAKPFSQVFEGFRLMSVGKRFGDDPDSDHKEFIKEKQIEFLKEIEIVLYKKKLSELELDDKICDIISIMVNNLYNLVLVIA